MFDPQVGSPVAVIVPAPSPRSAPQPWWRGGADARRPDAGDLAILGAGVRLAPRAMACVRTLRRVRVWSRSRTGSAPSRTPGVGFTVEAADNPRPSKART
jgi:hypothetical protein